MKNDSSSIQCVTAHVGSRDYYQLSQALYEAGLLNQLVTEIYANNWLKHVVPKLAQKRYCPSLPASAVAISMKAFYRVAQGRITRRNNNFEINRLISRMAYKVANRTDSNLFLYSYYAYDAFKKEVERKSSHHRILFQLHPHPLTIRRILENEIERLPFARQSIYFEDEFHFSKEQLNSLIEEPILATSCVTASQFTKNSLIENGIPADRIRVVPYGVETDVFPTRSVKPKLRPFRIIFVGRMNQRKGLADLLQAVRFLKSEFIEVVVCGRGYVDHNLLKEYKDVNMSVHYGLPVDQLVQELHQSHVFVFPTLAEGFGHVILEAMAAGLPIITTNNSCALDVMTEGSHGSIVPICSPESIAAKLEEVIDQHNEWYDMGQLAAQQAREFTWERFRRGIVNIYKQETASKT